MSEPDRRDREAPAESEPGHPGSTLEEIFSPGGILQEKLSNYEFRPSQLEMAQAVLDCIQHGSHLCVEAATGTGKTLAYLVPALYSRKRVIVSTATKNLQEQIFYQDIPFIRRHLHPGLTATYMKGRNNYLCLKKYAELAAQGELFEEEGDVLRRLSGWIEETETGDRAELDWIAAGDPLWGRLDARSETCTGSKCQHFDSCFITQMRRKALESDLILVNHALFFANLALQSDEVGQVLPDFAVAILDEAHEVEDIAANHFGMQISSYQIEELGRDARVVLFEHRELERRFAGAIEAGAALFAACPGRDGRHSLNFFRDPRQGMVDLRDGLRERYQAFRQKLEVLAHALRAARGLPEDGEALVRRVEQHLMVLETLFEENDPEWVYWFEKRGRGTFFHLTPIRVAPMLAQFLFENPKVESVVLTSATLSVDRRFAFIQERLGLPHPAEVLVEGEFDLKRQTMLYVPRDFPEPRSPSFLGRALADVERILEITDGHAFLLFTSFEQMHRFHDALAGRLPYKFLRQGERPRGRLLEEFKQSSRPVLCATSSFWQGVDVRGDALRAVVIDKLPFQVPSEPVVAARIHQLKESGDDPFQSYSVPEAIIALKQGLGRLIRSKTDRGVLAVLDSRLRTRSYGATFLSSLPSWPLTDKIEDLETFYRKA